MSQLPRGDLTNISMPKKIKAAVVLVSFLTVLFIVAGGLGVKASTNNDGSYRQIGVYSEVLQRIRSEYVEDPNIPQVTDGALHGLLESLDANSSYLNPAEYKAFRQVRNDAKANIGATLSKRFGYAAIVAGIPGGPAKKAGIENGDIIEAIEGRSTRDLSLAEIESLLSGQVGSVINISVVRPRKAQPQKIAITREAPSYPPAGEKMLEAGIGYVQVDSLQKGRAQEIANKLKDLQRQGAKKLILDLRNCASGDINEGIAAANLFLNRGTITYLQGQKYPKETFNADPSKALTTLPLVVLVNRSTAGAAEVVAASVLENARGDVLGDKTFGMASIQKVLELQDGSALILSIAKYYTPSGKAIQDAAVTPNILVADATDDFIGPDEDGTDSDTPEPPKVNQPDEQLLRAVEVLKNREQKS
jgi:carboxyl-terminal processing protease